MASWCCICHKKVSYNYIYYKKHKAHRSCVAHLKKEEETIGIHAKDLDFENHFRHTSFTQNGIKTMPPLPTKSVRATRVTNEQPADTFSYPGPEDINVPPDTFDSYMRVFFGHKAAGKTTLAASFPDSLTLMFEPVRKGLRIRMLGTEQGLMKVSSRSIREGGPDVWQKVVNTTPIWLEDPTIKCLNFDSIDILHECCNASVCARNDVDKPSDSKNGPDIWNEIRDEFSTYFTALRQTDMGINLLSHVKGREVQELDGAKLKGIHAPSCSPACLQFIRQASDFIFFLGTLNGQRACLVRDPTAQAIVAVSPEKVFLQPNGKELSVIAMPDYQEHPNAGYLHLVDGFNNKLWDMEATEEEKNPQPKVTGTMMNRTRKPARQNG